MFDFLSRLFDTSGFPPRWYCGSWTSGHGWLHILSDLGIWSAYVAIPCVLGFFALRRRDVPFRPIFWLFAAFILACGTTHLLEASLFWWPAYRLAGVVKLLTAVVSWVTVFALVPVTPRALAMSTPEELERDVAERTDALRKEVAERQQTESALRASEARIRQLADAMPQIVWTALPDGTVDYYNHRWYEFTGFPEWQGGDLNWKPILHPDDMQPCLDAWYAAVHAGLPYEIEYRFHDRRTGHYRWHLGRALPVRDESGRVVRWYGTSTDIDDQKRAEDCLEQQVAQRTAELTRAVEASRQSEAMFQGLFAFAPDAIIVATPEGRIQHANLAAEQTFGYQRDELVGQPVELLVPEHCRDTHRHFREDYAAAPRSRPMGEGRELYGCHKNGAEFPVDVLLAPLHLPAGLLVLATVRDISHRKANEHIIKTRARQQATLAQIGQLALQAPDLQALLDETAVLVARTLEADLSRVVELIDRSGTQRLLLRAGSGWKEGCVGTEIDNGLGSLAGYALHTDEPVIMEDLWSETRFRPSPLLAEHGVVSGISTIIRGPTGVYGELGVLTTRPRRFTAEDVVFVQTVAHLLAATVERRRAERQLQDSLAEKQVLLKEIHHRVKNNLQVISSLLDLQSHHTHDPAAVEMFRESQNRVRSMALVHERLYRSEDLARVNFPDYIESLTDYLFRSYKADREAVRLDLHMQADVWLPIDAAVPCGLLVNELVTNCLKHAFRGRDGGMIRVSIRNMENGGRELCIADDGVGLPEGVGPDTAETFGLQLVAMLVDQLRGQLTIDRTAGTAFRITFPLSRLSSQRGEPK